jgi:hypothetical protein
MSNLNKFSNLKHKIVSKKINDKEIQENNKEILERQKDLEKFSRQSYIIYEPRVLNLDNKQNINANNNKKMLDESNNNNNVKGETIYVNYQSKISNSKSNFTLSSSKTTCFFYFYLFTYLIFLFLITYYYLY